jgi:hypothetical protein
MTEEQFHEVYGSEVAGNHTVLGVPSDGEGKLCTWDSDCGTRFFWVTTDDSMTFGNFLTRDEMTAYLADAKYYKKHGTNMPMLWENKEHIAYLRKKGA